MPLELLRIDERLIHGQVSVGWGARLGIRHYVVVDDGLAHVGWEQDLYASALPDGATVEFLTVSGAIDALSRLGEDDRKTALLTRGTAVMRALGEGGALAGHRINVGGVHAREGRRRFLDFLYLSAEEVEDLRALAEAGARVTVRDLPTSPGVSLEELLDG